MRAITNVPYIVRNVHIECGKHGCLINRDSVIFDDNSDVVSYHLDRNNVLQKKKVLGRECKIMMGKWDNKIGFKHVQTRKLFFGYDKRKDFLSDIESTRVLVSTMGEEFMSNHTVIPLTAVDRCVGIEFRRSDVHQYKNMVNYVIPTTMCEANALQYNDPEFMAEHLQKLFIDLLVVVKRIQDVGLVHSDIKADNVVVCDGRFVLIDWGGIHDSLDASMPILSTKTNMPLSVSIQRRKRIVGFMLSKFSFLRKYTQRLVGIRMGDEEYRRWLDMISEVSVKQTRQILASDRNPDSVLVNYWKRLDLYCIGVTILQVIVKHRIDIKNNPANKRVIEWIEKCLTLGSESWKSAGDALAVILPASVSPPASVTGGGKEKFLVGKFGGVYVIRNGKRVYARNLRSK